MHPKHFAWYGNITYVVLSIAALGNAVLISYVKARAENLVDHCGVGAWQRGERCVVFLFAAFVGYLSLRTLKTRQGTETRWLAVAALLFTLSPTQFPWYYTWMIPYLTVRPYWPLQLYTVTLPLYSLQYYMNSHGARSWFENGVIWLEHGPVYLAVIIGYFMNRHSVGHARRGRVEVP